MSNGEFQGKYVHFNVIPTPGKTDQCIVSEPLVHKIASCHIMTTPHEIGVTAPPNKRHIPVNSQEPSPLSRQEHAQQAYTSHVTTYKYLNSSVMPKQECPNLMLHLLLVRYHTCIKINSSSPQQSKDSAQNNMVTQHLHQQTLN